MVDYDSYFQYGRADGRIGALEPGNSGPGCGCSDCQDNDGLMTKYRTRFDSPSSVNAKEWEEEQYLICPPRVLGYILQEKQWAQLQVTSLSEISNDTTQASALDQRLKLADDVEPRNQSTQRKKNQRGTYSPILPKTNVTRAYLSVRYQHKSAASRPCQKPHIHHGQK